MSNPESMEQSSILPPSQAVYNLESAHLSSLAVMFLLVTAKEYSLSSSWSTYKQMAVRFDSSLRMNISSSKTAILPLSSPTRASQLSTTPAIAV